MRRLFGRKTESFPVARITSTRALYIDRDIQRVEMKLELENGEIVRVDMNPRQCHSLIMQLSASYDAIHPPITRHNPTHSQG